MLQPHIYILGSGSIGLALAASLIENGRTVTLVRTSATNMPRQTIEITANEIGRVAKTYPVDMLSLDQVVDAEGILAITAKAFANAQIATALKGKTAGSPIVLMQNGLDIEQPFLDAGFNAVYRCILYTTSQKMGAFSVQYLSLKPCPVGVIRGTIAQLNTTIQQLHSEKFRFQIDNNIQNAIWEKVIFNAVFNTICPLLEAHNGVFFREQRAAELAKAVITECAQVAGALGQAIDPDQLLNQVLVISKGSDGQRPSTVDDIALGRPTELAFLNKAIVQAAKTHAPAVDVSKTKLLGELAMMKAELALKTASK